MRAQEFDILSNQLHDLLAILALQQEPVLVFAHSQQIDVFEGAATRLVHSFPFAFAVDHTPFQVKDV